MYRRAVDPSADDGVARQLLAVQRAAYAVEAELVSDDRIPQLCETAWKGWGVYPCRAENNRPCNSVRRKLCR